jgi:excisionase family DNA binding protein
MKEHEETEKLLTVSEVSVMLHVHPNTLRRWSEQGKIPSYRISPRGDRRFKFSDVTRFLVESAIQNKTSAKITRPPEGNGNGHTPTEAKIRF